MTMQLFHIDADKIHIKWNNLEIFPIEELILQLRKVLRIKKWDKICIQSSDKDLTIRYEILVLSWTDQKLDAEIISNQSFSFAKKKISMFIAMPNKREKAELIVQKLTEIWVQNIYFWASEHSIIRKRNDKKAERLNKISHEAVEQSRWIQIPEIKFVNEKDLWKFVDWKDIIIANMNWVHHEEAIKSLWKNLCGVIWPEWWFSEKDLSLFKDSNIVDLWNNVLRMETASIVLARLLKNM